jgi:hypothetical protein
MEIVQIVHDRIISRKRMGIEPTKPLLAQSFIGFEDRGRHQSGTRFRRGSYTQTTCAPTGTCRDREALVAIRRHFSPMLALGCGRYASAAVVGRA